MKRTYKIKRGKKIIEREYFYIPFRYIIAILISLIEILSVLGIAVACCYYSPYLLACAGVVEILCLIRIIASDDNPEYKVPWIVVVLTLPIIGFMLYLMFYSRKLKRKYVKRLYELKEYDYKSDDTQLFKKLARSDEHAASQARMLCNISGATLFEGTATKYYPDATDMWQDMLSDIEKARHFIFLEYFIFEEGVFWNSLLNALKARTAEGVTVRLIYDDIGCMTTLPGGYSKSLAQYGIEATPFSRLKGQADSEFNNRSHRKICVIDGIIGYTGGVNIADEYVNEKARFGHWKDTAIRLEGEAVREMTRLFMCDYGLNVKELPKNSFEPYPRLAGRDSDGFVIPFGDGPRPLYKRRVGKSVLLNMLYSATEYFYITTPYLIVDNDMCTAIENAALRGVDVRIILPHIPDKRIVFQITKSYYPRLVKAGVRIYEYTPGFIHAKGYLCDGRCAMIGSINLDYRSLVHHFENGVLLCGCSSISDMRQDFDKTLWKCEEITQKDCKAGLFTRLFRDTLRIFAPML